MPLTFSEKHAVLQDAAYKGAIQFAINKVGYQILNDGNGNSPLAYHVKRHALASGAVAYPSTLVDRFAFEVLVDYPNLGTPSDGDIEFLVGVVFNRVAGVTPADVAQL